MLTTESAKERMFCPICGKDDVSEISCEGDWWCEYCGKLTDPLRERDLQGKELIRLRLEIEQLREALRTNLCSECERQQPPRQA